MGTPLLVIDDDLKLCELIREYLEMFDYEVTLAHSGRKGLEAALSGDYAAIILDVMMPQMDGMEVLRRLRTQSSVPVLMLTGLGDEPDRILGLESGADDYVPKTFSTRELLARLRAVIRRSRATAARSAEAGSRKLEGGDVLIDLDTRTASLSGRILSLTPVEFDLLSALVRGMGRIQSREQLLIEVADRDFEVFDRSIDVHVSSLRKKLGDDARSPRYIRTIRSAGYLFVKPGEDTEP